MRLNARAIVTLRYRVGRRCGLLIRWNSIWSGSAVRTRQEAGYASDRIAPQPRFPHEHLQRWHGLLVQRFQFRSQRGRDEQAAVRLLAHGQAQRLCHFHWVICEVAIRALAVDGRGGPSLRPGSLPRPCPAFPTSSTTVAAAAPDAGRST